MNVSHTQKCVWWALPRSGTRPVWKLFEHYGFKPVDPEMQHISMPEGYEYIHTIGFPETTQDYTLIVNTRNPYSRTVSLWYWYCWLNNLNINAFTFNDFIKRGIIDPYGEDKLYMYKEKLTTKPYISIRYEFLEEDIKKIPFLNLNNPVVANAYKTYVSENYHWAQNGIGVLKKIINSDKKITDWQYYYNQKIADFVYSKCINQFNLFGYDKDSWKTN
jgi:hypothetical protein